MASWMEFLIGGILCLIISIVIAVTQKRITPGTIVAFVFFIIGVYKALTGRR